MSHYYLNDPNLKTELKKVTYTFRGKNLVFFTDRGVFSRERIDFGTNLLINSLTDSDLFNKHILDIGCGYGIVGISIGKAFSGSLIEMVDVNLRALELAQQNAVNNKVNNVAIYESNLYERVASEFDCIISNPPIRAGKEVVQRIISEGYRFLKSNGSIWVVIQKKQGAESLMKKMEEIFSNLEIVRKDKGYYILKSIKG